MKLTDSQKIILASKSPRRKDLLEQLGITIQISPSKVDEDKVPIYSAKEYALNLSHLKATTTAKKHPNAWVLGADTIVVIHKKILGKPKSEIDALDMLNTLNNKEHHVYTAFCLYHHTKAITVTRLVKTKVCFKSCTHDELKWYIKTREPFGKAGAYAIQEKGAFMVKSIVGSYSNVVGLPVCEVVEELKKLNLIQF